MDTYPILGFAEPVGSLIHLLGAGVFAVLTWFLVRRGRGDARRVAALGLFSFSCVLLLSLSGVYHLLDEGGTARAVLGRLDLAAIFVLIAGTQTPLQVIYFRGVARWGVLALAWTLAITGITLFSVFYDSLPYGLGTTIYLLLGWIAGGSGFVLWRRYGTADVKLLLLGGLVYTVAAILLGLGWPVLIPRVIGAHEVWHFNVIVAMSLQWAFVYRNAGWPLDGPPPVQL